MNRGRVTRLLRISRTVSDLARATAFYRDALGFRVASDTPLDDAAWAELMGIPGVQGSAVMLRLGEQELELVAFSPPGAPYPAESDSTDLWFQHIAIVVSDIEAAYTKLCGYSFTPISEDGPQRLPPGSGSVTAYKFRDPEGHPLELIQFPAGTDDPVWQHKEGPFLGIDHSAIDVADIAQSVEFYARVLGMRVASRSRNAGPTQQRLDRAREDVVDVVALQPAGTRVPHLELLGYRKPVGHPIPRHTKPNDIAADRLVLQVEDLTGLVEALRAKNIAFVSPGVVALASAGKAALIRDPTGHHLLLCT